MGANPSGYARKGGYKVKVENVSDADLRQFPVDGISWNDAQVFLEALRAVALAAGPGLDTVQVAAPAAGVRFLDLQQLEVLLPVGAFLSEGCGAEAHFDPLHPAVGQLTRVGHVAEVLVSRN